MIITTTWLVKYRDRSNQLREFWTTESDFDSAKREANSLIAPGERLMHLQYFGEFRKGDKRGPRAPKANQSAEQETVRQ